MKAMELTESDNEYIKYFKGKADLVQADIEKAMQKGNINKDYIDKKEEEIAGAAERILGKIHTINSEYLGWLEVLGAMIIAMIAYMGPIWMLEWIERYSNIFRDPISKCVNDYESGPWEALEAMKEEVTYQEFIRIIESLQAAVEKIPIKDAFDELDTERDYYQSKRKESNERLISKKGMIGKGIGFAPMVLLFVGYLIVPLVFIGLTSMSTSFNNMTI